MALFRIIFSCLLQLEKGIEVPAPVAETKAFIKIGMYAALSDSPYQKKMGYTAGAGSKRSCHIDTVTEDENSTADMVSVLNM